MKTVHNFVKSERELFSSSVRSFLPQTAIVPFSKKEYRCVVERNAVVSEGQVIALSEGDGQNAEALHAPVPGKVTDITQFSVSNGKTKSAVCISMAGSFSYLGRHQEKTNWKTFSEDYLLSAFSQKGVVNTFYIPKPLCSEIKSCTLSNNRFLVVRMFDEDPSRLTDTFISQNYSSSVVKGAFYIAKSFSAKGIIFVCPKKNFTPPDFVELGDFPYLCVFADTERYPSGFKSNLIQYIKKNSKTISSELFGEVNDKSLFVDSGTALDVYNAVTYKMPVVEKIVHVTGDCLRAAAMFKVRVGTPISALVEQCGGLKKPVAKILINGVLIGSSITSMDIPITKGVKSITFLPVLALNNQNLSPCIRCGKCRFSCSENLYPDLLFRSYMQGTPKTDEKLLRTAIFCSECNLCNSV